MEMFHSGGRSNTSYLLIVLDNETITNSYLNLRYNLKTKLTYYERCKREEDRCNTFQASSKKTPLVDVLKTEP